MDECRQHKTFHNHIANLALFNFLFLDYRTYFEPVLKDEKVHISLLKNADINALKKLTNVAVELKADIQNQSVSTFAVLNLEIIGE